MQSRIRNIAATQPPSHADIFQLVIPKEHESQCAHASGFQESWFPLTSDGVRSAIPAHGKITSLVPFRGAMPFEMAIIKVKYLGCYNSKVKWSSPKNKLTITVKPCL